MENLQSIAVLITCHNRKEKTLLCLQSLFQANLPKGYCIKVFLVDDGSTDGTSKAVNTAYPRVDITQGDGNLYWNRGMHLAWETAVKVQDYDFYLWLNDDVKVFENFIIVMINDYIQHKKSIVCGVLTSEFGNSITYGGRDEKGVLMKPSKENNNCYYINGNVVLVPNIIYDKIGILDKVFPHSIGDFDYGLRALQAGFSIVVSSKYVGYCESNSKLPDWCISGISLRDKINSLYSPLGNSHPYYYWIYSFRHFGFFKAFKYFTSIHLRLLFPQLWK